MVDLQQGEQVEVTVHQLAVVHDMYQTWFTYLFGVTIQSFLQWLATYCDEIVVFTATQKSP